jgi:predicted metal-dependent enzyme (double-stranded beta helix superfamily)
VRYEPRRRWYRRLTPDHDAAQGVEVWLLSWLPGQHTGLHDHGGASGGFVVAAGSLREHTAPERAGHRPRLNTRSYGAGRIRMFGPHHVHEIVNVGSQAAVSIHAYAPGLTTMRRYRWTQHGLDPISLERAGADW